MPNVTVQFDVAVTSAAPIKLKFGDCFVGTFELRRMLDKHSQQLCAFELIRTPLVS